MNAVGAGLLSILNESSNRAVWICFQIISSGATGMIFTATLPSTLAALPESDVAVATGTYSFVRSFGLVWGVIMASIVFSGQVNTHIGSIGDAAIRAVLADGAAYSYASGELTSALPPDTRTEVINAYVEALRAVWLVIAAVSCLGFCFVFVEKHVELRKDHTTEFGLAEGEHRTLDVEEVANSTTTEERKEIQSEVKPAAGH